MKLMPKLATLITFELSDLTEQSVLHSESTDSNTINSKVANNCA